MWYTVSPNDDNKPLGQLPQKYISDLSHTCFIFTENVRGSNEESKKGQRSVDWKANAKEDGYGRQANMGG